MFKSPYQGQNIDLRKIILILSIFFVTILIFSTSVSAGNITEKSPSQIVVDKNSTINSQTKKTYDNHKADPYLLKNLIFKSASANIPTSIPPARRQGLPSIGTVKVPVFLVDFPDYPHSSDQTVAEVNSKLFGNGDSSKYPFDSMRNYYLRSSFGQLTISGTVYGWYRAEHNRDVYNDNDDLSKEIFQYYDPTIDFSQYDNDNNGILDSFYVFWTGPDYKGLWYCGYVGTWWTDPNFRVDGKKLNEFVWSRYRDSNNDHFATICSIHETAHLMGLPDYYNVDGINWPHDGGIWPNGGVGAVDMMDGNADQNCFSKMLLGWIKPTIIASGEHYVTLKPSGNSKDAILIMPNTTGNIFGEFFMIQYRKKGVGNDPLLNHFNSTYPSDGLVIWHVDATILSNGDFKYNNFTTDHKLLKLMEADGQERIEYGLQANSDDFYTSKNTFGPTTYPNSNNYNGDYTGIQIDNISTSGNTISARISIKNNPPIQILSTALDNDLKWVTGGSNPWYIQNSHTKDGIDAVKSGILLKTSEYNPWSWIGTIVEGPGQLKFWWKISARENLDYLRVYVKEDQKTSKLLAEITGNQDWQEKTIDLGYGNHFIQWFYMKNNTSSTSGLDAGLLDNIEWIPTSIQLPNALDNSLNWDCNETLWVDNSYDNTNFGWFGQNHITHDGTDAAQACPIDLDANHGQWVNLNTIVQGPGILKFWWKITSQSPNDSLALFDGNTYLGGVWHQSNWIQKSFNLSSGTHFLHWQYYKAPDTTSGTNTAWLDQVEWTTTDKTPPNISPDTTSCSFQVNTLIVNLSINEEGTIYYTHDGSTPTTDSFIYSNPLKISTTTILKYFGIDLFGNKSSINTQTYTDKSTPKITADPNGINFTLSNIRVNLSINEGGKIYYTRDGTTPNINSFIYSVPLNISTTTILKYFGIDLVGNKSSIYTQTYTDKSTPTATVTPTGNYKIYKSNPIITLKMNEQGFIYYTIDGTTPSIKLKYSTPLTIKQTTILKFIAIDKVGNKSPVYTQKYTIDKTSQATWPRTGHDNQNTSQSPYQGPLTNHTKWNLSDFFTSTVAIGNDGTIYFGNNDYLYAILSTGKVKWRYKAADYVSSPSIGSFGTIYFGCDDHNVYAISPNGSLKWKYRTDSQINSSPIIGPYGTIYLQSTDGYMHVLTPDGKFQWKFNANDSPALDKEGNIYISRYDGLYALNPDGKQRWKYELADALYYSPAISPDGSVYFGCQDKNLYALDKYGNLKWKYKCSTDILSVPAIGLDGSVYFGCQDKNLYALDKYGNLKWKYQTNSPLYSSPALGKDGTIYLGSDSFYALRRDGKLQWKINNGNNFSPAIDKDGTVYAFCNYGLSAIQDLKVQKFDPVNNSLKVPVNKVIKITFNGIIKASNTFNNITLKNFKGVNIAITKQISGNILTIKKSRGYFALGDKYTIYLPVQCLKDTIDNNLPASYQSTFTTPNYLLITTLKGPLAGKRGTKIYVDNIIKNQGLLAARNFYVHFYLTPTKSLSGTKYYLDKRFITQLSPDSVNSHKTALTVPLKMMKGNYYIAAVADNLRIGYSEGRINIT